MMSKFGGYEPRKKFIDRLLDNIPVILLSAVFMVMLYIMSRSLETLYFSKLGVYSFVLHDIKGVDDFDTYELQFIDSEGKSGKFFCFSVECAAYYIESKGDTVMFNAKKGRIFGHYTDLNPLQTPWIK